MPQNEDLLVIPDDWRATLHPRRGGTHGPPLELVPDAVSTVRQWVKESRDEIDHLLESRESRRDLVGSARAHLGGEANPQGAGVLAAVIAAEWPLRDDYEHDEEPFAVIADAWIAEHGLVFAAAATVELSGVFVDGYKWKERRDWRHLRVRRLDKQDPGYNHGLRCLELVAARVRAFLAVAAEPEYQRAVEALGGLRHDGMRRLAAAYLVPTQTAWVDELCGTLPDLEPYTWMMVLRTIGSADHLATLRAGHSGWYWIHGRPGVLPTVVEGVGPALASTLATVADEETETGRDPYELLRALGVLATDEAFRLLVDRLDRPQAQRAVIETARRFPERALRLLGEAAVSGPAPISSYAVRLLRDHVAARADVAAAVLPRLPAEVREVVESIDELAAGWAPAAPAESLPRLLVEPPWTRERPKFKRMTVKGLQPLTTGVPGESEERAAARALIPIALGKTGPQRFKAEAALRRIVAAEGDEGILEVAGEYGAKAAKAARALLAADPLDDLPAVMPRRPVWQDPHLLPQVLLRESGLALPLEAVDHIVSMLAVSTPDKPYAGIDVVKEICDPACLAPLAWRLFELSGRRARAYAWEGDDWVLTALGLFGDDETVRKLTPVIQAWPGDGGHHRAVKGLDVLLAIGTDVALMHLHGLATKVKYKGLRKKAQERIDSLAEDLGLSPDQLGDRLVPDFGLDESGGMLLDYGPRGFTAGFDEQLRPYVIDDTGRRRASLPKPGVRDDQELAPAAHRRFAALKKDVRTVAGEQLRRFERAMVTQRRWTAEEFRTLIVEHPLVRHVARRLVWITEDGRAFRIAEDRTFADLQDDALALTGPARVGVAHPLQLSGSLEAWAEVFDDYETTQPFPQLRRPTYALTEEERAGTELERFHGVTVPVGRVVGMERRGWQRGSAEDNGIQVEILRELPGGRAAVITVNPGIPAGDINYWPEQRIDRVRLDRDARLGRRAESSPLPFSELDAITASEVLADVVALTTA
ncbi:DUF4132 domain-containing protein [Actinomadura xylanilytica]|uniref:DUF4132 domain-containing protein n=1 Tax=Actinomadura xylanilytica TaxID=887459 RepID=UPI00255AF588|nr:DUF4132 domain-containing protein [Actinomadura xylanilytica]MDL4775279.1 DUF4132 domain-containing protein [Actinomadura xylanilytica]